jgi:transcriptional regulator NrdR family protein
MGLVVKKSGKKQTFSAAKIRRSIDSAAKEAKVSAPERKKLVKEVADPVIDLYKKKRVVKAADLRRSILGRLARKRKKVASAWRKYDRKKKK